jgi:hypothetical protein
MASWNNPSNSQPATPSILKDLADKDTYSATMGQVNLGAYTDLPDGVMNWDNGQKLLRRLQSGTPEVVKISLAGGGTGASDADGARAAFNVLEAGTGAAQSRTNTQNDSRFVQGSRSISTTSPLHGGGDLSANRTLSIQDASTTQKGAVQLENTLNSTSTTKALTAAQGKALNDAITGLPDVGYYNEQTLNASGSLSSGSCKVVRVGSMVTISGLFIHSSSAYVESPANFIPSWARPGSSVNNYYSAANLGANRTISIVTGTMYFQYDTAQTSTSGFTISYTI